MSAFLLPSLYSSTASKKTKDSPSRKTSGYAYLTRPLVGLIRQPAAALEYLVDALHTVPTALTYTNQKLEARKATLHLELLNASTFETWREAGAELDRIEGNNAWKLEQESDEYDYMLVEARLAQMNEARLSQDPDRMMFLVRTALTRHLGGMGSILLYKHSYIGTKKIIEQYIGTALDTLNVLLDATRKSSSSTLESRDLLDQVLAARQSFGRSALMLSGGGTFGMSHIGVVKSLWEAKLLPRIISGSSAGSIVCAVLCVTTDEDIPEVLKQFCYGDLKVFTSDGQDNVLQQITRFLKLGSLFDISNLIRVMKNLLGDITFQEAYNRTRRILNICVSSASIYELPRLLNYVTAPNVIIWSAVAASCSVPFIFSPAALLAKDQRSGQIVPWNPSPQCWIDGSVDNDLPMTRVSEMFNVNHFIVSQVNPHVVPFLSRNEDNFATDSPNSAVVPGAGLINTIASLARDEAMHRMHILSELGILPNVLTKTRSILSQRYSGDITIFPEVAFEQFPKVLQNPTTDFMVHASLTGERATWPKLSRIQNHCAIELALDDAVQQLRARIAFSPSQVDLRLGIVSRPLSRAGSEKGRTKRRSGTTLQEKTKKAPPAFRTRNSFIGPTSVAPSKQSNDTRSRKSSSSHRKTKTLPVTFELSPKLFERSNHYDFSDSESEDSDYEQNTGNDRFPAFGAQSPKRPAAANIFPHTSQLSMHSHRHKEDGYFGSAPYEYIPPSSAASPSLVMTSASPSNAGFPFPRRAVPSPTRSRSFSKAHRRDG